VSPDSVDTLTLGIPGPCFLWLNYFPEMETYVQRQDSSKRELGQRSTRGIL
jgi:hypothetical protein